MSFVIKAERNDEVHDGFDEMSRGSYLPSDDVLNKYYTKQESADDGDNDSGDVDDAGDVGASSSEDDSVDDDDSDANEFHDDGVHVGDLIKVKDEPDDSDLVFEFIEREKLDENEDKYNPDDQSLRDGAPSSGNFDGSSVTHDHTHSAIDILHNKKVDALHSSSSTLRPAETAAGGGADTETVTANTPTPASVPAPAFILTTITRPGSNQRQFVLVNPAILGILGQRSILPTATAAAPTTTAAAAATTTAAAVPEQVRGAYYSCV